MHGRVKCEGRKKRHGAATGAPVWTNSRSCELSHVRLGRNHSSGHHSVGPSFAEVISVHMRRLAAALLSCFMVASVAVGVTFAPLPNRPGTIKLAVIGDNGTGACGPVPKSPIRWCDPDNSFPSISS